MKKVAGTIAIAFLLYFVAACGIGESMAEPPVVLEKEPPVALETEAPVGRYQISVYNNGGGLYGYYLLDTTNGELWIGSRGGVPKRVPPIKRK